MTHLPFRLVVAVGHHEAQLEPQRMGIGMSVLLAALAQLVEDPPDSMYVNDDHVTNGVKCTTRGILVSKGKD